CCAGTANGTPVCPGAPLGPPPQKPPLPSPPGPPGPGCNLRHRAATEIGSVDKPICSMHGPPSPPSPALLPWELQSHMMKPPNPPIPPKRLEPLRNTKDGFDSVWW